MHVYLIGYMGSGKSSLGKRLANKLNLPFFDIDHIIEDITGMTISTFFDSEGEEAFRKKEQEVLNDLIKIKKSILVSTGGGTPCFYNNMELMNDSGITLYLERSVKELAHRIHYSKKSRPLVDQFSLFELEGFIEKHLKDRTSFYKQSRMTIPREEQSVEGLVDIILDQGWFTAKKEEPINSNENKAKKNQ